MRTAHRQSGQYVPTRLFVGNEVHAVRVEADRETDSGWPAGWMQDERGDEGG